MKLSAENTTMSGFSSADASTHAARDLITTLKYPAESIPFESLSTEKFNALRKIMEIFQGQITPKDELDTTETQTKIVEE